MVNRMIVKKLQFFVQASIPSLCAIMTVYIAALVPQTMMICILSYGCEIVLNDTVIVLILQSFVISVSLNFKSHEADFLYTFKIDKICL